MAAGCALAVLWTVGLRQVAPARFALAADAAHRLEIEAASRVEMAAVAGEPHLRTTHFDIAYPAGGRADAQVVAQSLERYYPEVTAHIGLVPPTPVPVRIETATGMAAVFGTPPGAPPLGAYWRGVLWFLAPSAWLPQRGPALAAAYNRDGPAPHELTHLLDDLRTGGTLPVWLDEGVAQYEEWRDNGYVWRDRENRLGQPLYSWRQLETDFQALPNQALAYREAFLVVRTLGPQGVDALLADVGAGRSPDAALRAVVGAARYRALVAGSAWATPGAGTGSLRFR